MRLAGIFAVTFAGFFLLGYGGILIGGGDSHQASALITMMALPAPIRRKRAVVSSAEASTGSLPPERAHEFAHVIGHNGELLQRLHDDLSDMARAEAGTLSVMSRRVALQDTLRTCISGLKLDTQLGGKPVLLGDMDSSLAVSAGPGILAEERDYIFRPFGRERGGRQVPGAALGLSMAKLLVEKQGGRIDFESIPGRQTRFWIDLPLVA